MKIAMKKMFSHHPKTNSVNSERCCNAVVTKDNTIEVQIRWVIIFFTSC